MSIKGVGQLLQTAFNWSLATVRFMMNKSMDQKPEVNIIVIRFCYHKLSSNELTTFLNYKLKRLSFSLLICRTQSKIFRGGLAIVSFSSSWFDVKAKLKEPLALNCVQEQRLNVGLLLICCYPK